MNSSKLLSSFTRIVLQVSKVKDVNSRSNILVPAQLLSELSKKVLLHLKLKINFKGFPSHIFNVSLLLSKL